MTRVFCWLSDHWPRLLHKNQPGHAKNLCTTPNLFCQAILRFRLALSVRRCPATFSCFWHVLLLTSAPAKRHLRLHYRTVQVFQNKLLQFNARCRSFKIDCPGFPPDMAFTTNFRFPLQSPYMGELDRVGSLSRRLLSLKSQQLERD